MKDVQVPFVLQWCKIRLVENNKIIYDVKGSGAGWYK